MVALARDLFTRNLFAFEATALLLTIATVGAVVLVRNQGGQDLVVDEPGTASDDRLEAETARHSQEPLQTHDDRNRGFPMEVTQTWYLVLSAVLFTIGTVGLLTRRNPLVMFMCIELMLNAVNLSFVAFSKSLNDIAGQTAVFFVLVVAAAEVVVGLSIVVAVLRRRPTATADDIAALRG